MAAAAVDLVGDRPAGDPADVRRPTARPRSPPGDDLAAMLARALVDLARRRRRRGHQQGGQQGRGPGPAPATARRRSPARPSGWSPAAAPTAIVRTRHGLTLAAAGVDASNVAAGHVVLLPEDPDASARALRAAAAPSDRPQRRRARHRHRRPGLARGPDRHRDRRGRAARARALRRPHRRPRQRARRHRSRGRRRAGRGRRAGAGQARPAGRSPCVRGRADLVLPPGDDGPGATALLRAEGADLFGYGAREAVVAALAGDPADQAGVRAPGAADELVAALAELPARRRRWSTARTVVVDAGDARPAGRSGGGVRPRLGGRRRRVRRRVRLRPCRHSVDSAATSHSDPSPASTPRNPHVAKQAKTDRQAVIEQIRAQQKSAERRRGLMIVGVCAVVAVLHHRRRRRTGRSRTRGTCASSATSRSTRSARRRRSARR